MVYLIPHYTSHFIDKNIGFMRNACLQGDHKIHYTFRKIVRVTFKECAFHNLYSLIE